MWGRGRGAVCDRHAGAMSEGKVTRAPRLDAAGEASVVAAIKRAERGNRGEVRVHLEASAPGGDAFGRARALFRALGVHATKGGTGVLLYVAVDDRKAAVFAGPGVHGAQAAGFWQGVTDAVAAGAREGSLARGIVEAVDRVGEALRRAVPGRDRDGNELPDAVTSS